MRDDRAADRAMRADILADRDRGAGRRRWTSLGCANGTERQSTERGKAASGEPRAAQEAATIDAVACLRREHAGKRAAASLTFCPLDQHDRAPSLRRIAVDAIKALHI